MQSDGFRTDYAIFGPSDGTNSTANGTNSQFGLARSQLVDACTAYSERAVDSGVSMLEERVRSALGSFRGYFQGLQGKSVRLTHRELSNIFDTVTRILTATGVAKVFSVSAPSPDWPLLSTDPNGAKLVESVGVALQLSREYTLQYMKFLLLQRVAQEGKTAVALCLGELQEAFPRSDIKEIISAVYSWGTSLKVFLQAP